MPEAFQSTRWSIIQQAAGTNVDVAEREKAWREFDRLYRGPLSNFIVRAGWSSSEAEDLLQGFLAKLSEKEWLKQADKSRGKMRTFLLSKLKGHLSDARKYQNAQKRGGDAVVVSIDDSAEIGESGSDLEFDREWAQSILDRALATLQAEAEEKGQGDVFLRLRSQLTGDVPEKLRDAAIKLGESEGTLRMQLSRLRERFRTVLREEVAETLLPGEDVSAEMRYLAQILG